ncbi:MAG: metallophosphoesterase [Clostridia bacterium]|nr:metallophosphoesterase [Clostridia bacterium]
MKKAFRIIALILLVLMCFTACDTSDIPADTEPDEENTVSTSEGDVTDKQTEETNPADEPGKTTVVGSSADKKGWLYRQDNGVLVREVDIDSGKGGEAVEIIQITDTHISYMNDNDKKDPVLLDTYNTREWLRNAGGWRNAKRCLDSAVDADRVILTGDIIDYMSEGALEFVKNNIFDKYSNVNTVVGNHEVVKAMGEDIADADLPARMEYIGGYFTENVYYHSEVLGDKVMIIQLDNGSDSRFWESQIEPLREDLAIARKSGLVVLLFYHIPIATGNIKYAATKPIYDNGGGVRNFAAGIGVTNADSATAEVYNIITNNGDIIKGAFCGHVHNHYYTEITAKTASGEPTVIPQYMVASSAYDYGHMLKITVK